MKTIYSIITVILGLSLILNSCNKAVELSDLKLDKDQLELVKGESVTLKVNVEPSSLSESLVLSWSSSDEAVVSVSEDGTVTAISVGTAVIEVTGESKSASCVVTVLPKSVDEIVLDCNEMELEIGESRQLVAELLPDDADFSVEWSSADANVAFVNNKGLVSAMSKGKTEIIAKAGDIQAKCMVTVIGKPVEEIILNASDVDLLIGQKYELKASILPEDADADLLWESSDESVVSVVDGVVTALAEGMATVIVSSENVKAECSFEVIGDAIVGDYYYSDGTYSSELKEDKIVIGIVFWTGNPTEHDATLAKDHPQCTHGLVMAIGGESVSPWQSSYKEYEKTIQEWIEANTQEFFPITSGSEDRVNKINGYNNTKAIEAFNAASENSAWTVEAVDAAVKYRETVKAPENTSDWYLPSIKEMSLICTGEYDGDICDIFDMSGQYTKQRDYFNSIIEKVDGAVLIDKNGAYWGSNEKDERTSYSLMMSMGTAYDRNKSYDATKVRFVFAF